MKFPVSIDGLGRVVESFDLFLVDQFGVLHNGMKPYDGAVECLAQLTALRKTLILLTNSGKRTAANEARLIDLGFRRSIFTHVVSSGEVAWRGIASGAFGSPFVAGKRVHLVGRAGDNYGFEGLGLTLVDDAATAEFVIIAGSEAPRTSLAQYAQRLSLAAGRGIPALCCNPDDVMLTGEGLQPAPGAIAALYRKLGGTVVFAGKPHAAIYSAARALSPQIEPARILVVGDSVEHDVRGGSDAGLATALVRNGILADWSDERLDALMVKQSAIPDFILPAFRWK